MEVADHVALRVDLDHVRVAAAVEDHVGLQEDDPLVPVARPLELVVDVQHALPRVEEQLCDLALDARPHHLLPELLAAGLDGAVPVRVGGGLGVGVDDADERIPAVVALGGAGEEHVDAHVLHL